MMQYCIRRHSRCVDGAIYMMIGICFLLSGSHAYKLAGNVIRVPHDYSRLRQTLIRQ